MYRMQFGMTNGYVNFMQNLLCNGKKSRARLDTMDGGSLHVLLDFCEIIKYVVPILREV